MHDLQTREKFYFLCQNWLAVEHSDGLIDRILPVAGDKQKTDLSYLMKKQAKQNMSDGHLWFSVFTRPVHSSFTRLDRVTCCFVLLYITMLMNIMYYGLADSASSGGIELGPFRLTPEQVCWIFLVFIGWNKFLFLFNRIKTDFIEYEGIEID